jgi:hypothetical protein
MEQWWSDIGRKSEGVGEKPVPVPLCSHGLFTSLMWTAFDMNLGLHSDKVVTKHLSYGTDS